MIIKNLDITEIKLTSFNPKTNSFSLLISFSNGSNERSLLKDFSLISIEPMVDNIIREIRQAKKPEPESTNSDDPLAGVVIVNLLNEDVIREKFFKFFVKLQQKAKSIRNVKKAREYMDLFRELSSMRAVIYSK